VNDEYVAGRPPNEPFADRQAERQTSRALADYDRSRIDRRRGREDFSERIADPFNEVSVHSFSREQAPCFPEKPLLLGSFLLAHRLETRADAVDGDDVDDGDLSPRAGHGSREFKPPASFLRTVVGQENSPRARLTLLAQGAHGRWKGTLESSTFGSKRRRRLM